MPATISTGAGRCDVAVDPDEGASVAFTWPSALTGRTFAAALDDGTALTAVVNAGAGKVTVTWPAGIVAMTGWKLRETTSTPRTKISGKVVPLARTPSTGTVQVHDADAVPVDVTVVGAQGNDGPPGADATAIYGDPVAIVHGGTGATTAAAARTALGLDTAATQPASAFDAAGAAAAEAARALAAEALLAPLASPALTGSPTAPTQAPGNSSTRVATTAYADAAIAALVNSAPGTLDTLGEIATALQSDESGAAALAATVAGKLAKAANLSDVADVPTARTNLGLGTAATHAATDFDAAGAAAAEAARAAAAEAARALSPGAGVAPDLWGPSRLAPAGLTIAAAVTTAWPANNTALFQRLDVPVKRAYRYACFGIGTAAGNIQVGVVRLSGTSLLNYSVVMDSGVIACPAAADIRLDLGSVSLQAGDYAIFAWASSTSLLSGLTVASGANIPRLRLVTSVASLSGGVPSSGSLSDWAGTRVISAVIEADV